MDSNGNVLAFPILFTIINEQIQYAQCLGRASSTNLKKKVSERFMELNIEVDVDIIT